MTEHVFEMTKSGPIVLGLDLPQGTAQVQVLASVTRARVVLRTRDTEGPAADAVCRARSREDGPTLAVEVPNLPDNVMTQSVRGNRVVQNVCVVDAGTTVTGMTIVDGQVITGGGKLPAVSPIEARVMLPAGSSLGMISKSADLLSYGPLEQAEFRSVSGDGRFSAVRELAASTTSGDIEAVPYAGQRAELETTSGDVTVHAISRASGPLAVCTVSGDIRVSGGPHLDLHTRSVCGDIRTR